LGQKTHHKVTGMSTMRWLLLGLLLVLSLQGCAEQRTGDSQRAADQWLQPTLSLMRSGVVTRLEIIYLPKWIETPVPVLPRQLEGAGYYRISIEHFDESKLKRDLLSVLESSDMKQATAPDWEPDCRWGCVFYNQAGVRVLGMYFDAAGVKGWIGKTPVTLRRRFGKLAIVRLLESRCSSLWE